MRHFCQYGLCCDLVTCGLGVHDIDEFHDEFIGLIWLCEYHADRNPDNVLVLDAPFTTFDRLASPIPRRGPISDEYARCLPRIPRRYVMTEQTQILVSMFGLLWVTTIGIGGFMFKFMLEMNTRLGDIKAELAEIKAEIRLINKRLDSLETGITARR